MLCNQNNSYAYRYLHVPKVASHDLLLGDDLQDLGKHCVYTRPPHLLFQLLEFEK